MLLSLKNVLRLLGSQDEKHACMCNVTTIKTPIERQRMKKKNEIERAAVAIVFPSTVLHLRHRKKGE